MHADLAKTIDDAFEKRNEITPATKGPVREAVETALDLLDRGKARVAGGTTSTVVMPSACGTLRLRARSSNIAAFCGSTPCLCRKRS